MFLTEHPIFLYQHTNIHELNAMIFLTDRPEKERVIKLSERPNVSVILFRRVVII